jgi:cytochrome c heme-lyase
MADDAETCPVDHKTRDAWLSQARAAEAAKQAQSEQNQPATCPVDHSSKSAPSSSWTQKVSSLLWSSPSAEPALPANHPAIPSSTSQSGLDNSRITSTIPRSFTTSPEECPVDHGASANPSNAEVESGLDASGNWVYPSEKMFFDAMKRKGYDAREVDMKTVVPIHNAVNERAWKEIKEWEAPYLTESKCVSLIFIL